MDLYRVLAELSRERDLIDEAIAHLELLSTGERGIPGRPRRRVGEDKPLEKARVAGAAFD
jgi:hypothetical protein